MYVSVCGGVGGGGGGSGGRGGTGQEGERGVRAGTGRGTHLSSVSPLVAFRHVSL